MRVRVTIEYDYEDPDEFTPEGEVDHWKNGRVDCRDGSELNMTVKAEKIS